MLYKVIRFFKNLGNTAAEQAPRIGTHTQSSAAGVITHSKSTAAGIVAHSWGAATGVGHLKGGGVSSVSVGSNVSRGRTGSRVHMFCGVSNDVRVNV